MLIALVLDGDLEILVREVDDRHQVAIPVTDDDIERGFREPGVHDHASRACLSRRGAAGTHAPHCRAKPSHPGPTPGADDGDQLVEGGYRIAIVTEDALPHDRVAETDELVVRREHRPHRGPCRRRIGDAQTTVFDDGHEMRLQLMPDDPGTPRMSRWCKHPDIEVSVRVEQRVRQRQLPHRGSGRVAERLVVRHDLRIHSRALDERFATALVLGPVVVLVRGRVAQTQAAMRNGQVGRTQP